MEVIRKLFSFIFHIDQHLVNIIQLFDGWSYVILFFIIFVETGVVIFHFYLETLYYSRQVRLQQ